MMKTLSVGFLLILVSCLCAGDLQAKLAVLLQQRDGVIATVDDGKRMVTGDNVTYLLAGDEVSAKASRLRGQSVHILFYATNEEKFCVDLRPAVEPDFKISPRQKRKSRQEKKDIY